MNSGIKSRAGVLRLGALLAASEIVLAAIDPTPNREIAIGFIALVAQFVLMVLLATVIGTVLARAILRTRVLLYVWLNGFWLAQWLAIIGLWITPYVSILAFVGTVSATVHYSILSNICEEHAYARRWLTVREVSFYGLLAILIVHVLEPTGFAWFAVARHYGEVRAFAAFLFVLSVIYLFSAILPTNRMRTRSLLDASSTNHRVRTVLCWSLSCVLLVPLIWRFTMGAGPFSSVGGTWTDISISLIEIAIGLGLSLSVTVCLCGMLHEKLRQDSGSFEYSYLIPAMIMPFLLKYGILTGAWLSISTVFALSFFPCFRVWSSLETESRGNRVAVTLSETLPYGFVGMLFGETLHSFQGLGFGMLVETVPNAAHQQKSEVWLTTAFLLALTSAITYGLRRRR